MSPSAATALLWLAGSYGLVGGLIALVLVSRFLGRLDPLATQAPWGFRLLVAPAVAALWPLLLVRLLGARTGPPEERNAHRDQAHPPGDMVHGAAAGGRPGDAP